MPPNDFSNNGFVAHLLALVMIGRLSPSIPRGKKRNFWRSNGVIIRSSLRDASTTTRPARSATPSVSHRVFASR